MDKLIFILFITLLVSACSPSIKPELVTEYSIKSTQVGLWMNRFQPEGLLFFNMHDNENTSVDAAMRVLKRKGGTLYELVHTGNRNIEFRVDTSTIKVDPNRIFTETGVRKKLADQGAADSSIVRRVAAFGQELVALLAIDERDIVITLHNNTDENYSFESYTEGGEYEADALATFNGRRKDPDEFYFVTSIDLFEKLKSTGFNVVLQNNLDVTDDGSLSVYCGMRGIDYVNVEAQHGHTARNRKMIRKLIKVLSTD